MSEYEYAQKLKEARAIENDEEETEQPEPENPELKTRKLTFWEKLSKHWYIMVLAAFFDLLAIVPFLSVIINFIFGAILFLCFGPKRKAGEASELQKIALPVFIGMLIEIALSILPTNMAVAAVRIAFSKE